MGVSDQSHALANLAREDARYPLYRKQGDPRPGLDVCEISIPEPCSLYIVLCDSLTTYSSKNFLKENLYFIEGD